MSRYLGRREFLKHLLLWSAAGSALGLAGCGTGSGPEPSPAVRPSEAAVPSPTPETEAGPAPLAPATPAGTAPYPDVAVARGPGASPAELTRRAIAALGGIERFVKPGHDVIVKPNICNAYHGPEYASTTNPEVVATIVSLCLAAGARRVRVMDYPFGGTPQAAYEKSGIASAVAAAGGQMEVMNRMKYRATPIPAGRRIKEWQVYGDILDADVVINVPIAKDHSSARLTLGMKNLMGVVENRTGFHARGLHQCIADLNTLVRPQLTVVDAVRILVDNGPTGGNLDDVRQTDTVIASTDVVAADAYAATLFGLQGRDIGYIRLGAEMGLGRLDLDALKIEEITVEA